MSEIENAEQELQKLIESGVDVNNIRELKLIGVSQTLLDIAKSELTARKNVWEDLRNLRFENIRLKEKMSKKVYSIVCSRCGKGLGKTSEVPNVVVCLECYYRKD